MSAPVLPVHPTPMNRSVPLPVWARAAIYGVVWLPSLVLSLFYLSQFQPVFERFEQRGQLPALFVALFWFRNLGLPFFGLLVLADIVVGWTFGRLERLGALYWVWFAAVITLGLHASLLIVISPMALVFIMGSVQ